ncbi:hypothetical protein EJB05_14806, partial [Eragrostis curvula]
MYKGTFASNKALTYSYQRNEDRTIVDTVPSSYRAVRRCNAIGKNGCWFCSFWDLWYNNSRSMYEHTSMH